MPQRWWGQLPHRWLKESGSLFTVTSKSKRYGIDTILFIFHPDIKATRFPWYPVIICSFYEVGQWSPQHCVCCCSGSTSGNLLWNHRSKGLSTTVLSCPNYLTNITICWCHLYISGCDKVLLLLFTWSSDSVEHTERVGSGHGDNPGFENFLQKKKTNQNGEFTWAFSINVGK